MLNQTFITNNYHLRQSQDYSWWLYLKGAHTAIAQYDTPDGLPHNTKNIPQDEFDYHTRQFHVERSHLLPPAPMTEG
jgi:hypothetical protein